MKLSDFGNHQKLILESMATPLYINLRSMKPVFAKIAQRIYDKWVLSKYDFGKYGDGRCDYIADALTNEINKKSTEWNVLAVPYGRNKAGNHAYAVAFNKYESYLIDIPYWKYEVGRKSYGTMQWKKITGVKFTENDVRVIKIKRQPFMKWKEAISDLNLIERDHNKFKKNENLGESMNNATPETVSWQNIHQHIDNTNPHLPNSPRNAWKGMDTGLSRLVWHKELIQPNDSRIDLENLNPLSKRDVVGYAKHYKYWKDHPHYKGIPAIILTLRNGKFVVQDGAHRLAASIKLNIPIEAYIGEISNQLKENEDKNPSILYHGTTPDAAKSIIKNGLMREKSRHNGHIFTTSDRGLALSYAKEESTPEFGGKKFNTAALIVFKSDVIKQFKGDVNSGVNHVTYNTDIGSEAIDRIEFYKVSDIQKYVDEENRPNKSKPIKITIVSKR